MNSENMEQLYGVIANTINRIIPVDWDKVYLYANIDNDTSFVFFYYYPKNETKPSCSLNIPNEHQIDKREYNKLDYDLSLSLRKLQNEFVINKQEAWTNLTFFLLESGKFDIYYGYEDLSDVSYDTQQMVWEYKNLGILPENEKDMAIIQKYLV